MISLTNHKKIIFFQHKPYIVYQIQNEKHQLGGWVSSLTNIDEAAKAWIGPEAAVLGCSRIGDSCKVLGKSILLDTILHGRIFVHDGTIIDSELTSPGGIIKSQYPICNQCYTFTYSLDDRITNTNHIGVWERYGITAIYNDKYCKVGCRILTWAEAASLVHEAQTDWPISLFNKFLSEEQTYILFLHKNQILQEWQAIIDKKIEQGT